MRVVGGGRYGWAMTEKEKLLERAPKWSEAQASAALRAGELEGVDLSGLDGEQLTEVLNRIPGAWERTQEGTRQALRGEGRPIDELI